MYMERCAKNAVAPLGTMTGHLGRDTSIIEMPFRGRGLCPKAVEELSLATHGRLQMLKSVDFSENPGLKSSGCATILKSLHDLPRLASIDLRGCHAGDRGLTDAISLLWASTSLT